MTGLVQGSEAAPLVALADVLLVLVRAFRSGVPPAPGVNREDIDELVERAGLAPAVAETVRVAVGACSPETIDGRARECARLFDGAAVCPPNETAWIRRDKGHMLADIAGFYRAFGFRVALESGEKADHVVAEVQFIAVLLVFLARAIEAAEDDRREITLDALTAFAEDHLGPWIGPFCARVLETTSEPGLRAIAAALPEVLGHALDRAGVRATVPEAAVEPGPEDGTPYECDGCLR